MESTGARHTDSPAVEVSTQIVAPPEQVWRLVCDIELMPTISDELQAVEWADGVVGPRVGAVFVGHNHNDALRQWSTRSHIIACDELREFAWAVGDPDQPAATWRFQLAPGANGTTVSYRAQLGPGPSGLSLAIDAMPDKEQKIVFVRLRQWESAITATLAAIKQLAEAR